MIQKKKSLSQVRKLLRLRIQPQTTEDSLQRHRNIEKLMKVYSYGSLFQMTKDFQREKKCNRPDFKRSFL